MTEPEDFSSDTSDDDYIPEEESDDEPVSNDEKELESRFRAENGDESRQNHPSKSLKRKKVNGSEPRKRKGGIALAEENVDDNDVADNETANSSDKEEIKGGEETNKKRADDLWSSFMKDVEMKPKPKLVDNEPRNSITNNKKEEKLVITKVYEFAGEEVRVTEEVDSSSKSCNEQMAQQREANTSPLIGSGVKKGGIGNILSKLGGKKKISTLEKSRLDWNQFKQAEGIEEELNTFNKGKDGYLEKQAFLERSDLRQFEIERNLRMSNRSNR